jgi:hypothetical protein
MVLRLRKRGLTRGCVEGELFNYLRDKLELLNGKGFGFYVLELGKPSRFEEFALDGLKQHCANNYKSCVHNK